MAPRLSIVVPMYNVEPYLAECLESLASQSFADFEVVMVDDGSTDTTAEIAKGFATADPRFRLVQQENKGLGAARNTGVANATGEFLTFVDSDDLIPEHAYELMVGTLDETGSDFVSGNVRRLTPFGIHQSPMHRGPFAHTRLRTHISRDDLLMYDRLAPNKMFRRSFWDEHGLAFPEGVLYEDIPLTIPAHFLAKSVDILNTCTYLWRERVGGDASITQRRTEVKAVVDRTAAVRHVSNFLAERGLLDAKLKFDRVALGSDLRIFVNVVDQGDSTFQQVLLEVMNDFLDNAEPTAVDGLIAINRLKYHLVRRRLIKELVEVVRYEKYRMNETTTERTAFGKWYANYPLRGDKIHAIPDEIYRLGPELRMRSSISDISWRDGKLHVEGTAYIDLIDLRHRWSIQKVGVLRLRGSRRMRPVVVKNVFRPDANASSQRLRQRFDWAGYAFDIDPDALKVNGRWTDSVWSMHLAVHSHGVVRRQAVRNPAPGRAERPPTIEIEPDVFIQPQVVDKRLTIRVLCPTAMATGCEQVGDALVVSGWLTPGPSAPTELSLSRRSGATGHRYPLELDRASGTRQGWRVTVPLADLTGGVELADRVAHVEQAGEGADWDARLVRGDRAGDRVFLSPAAEEHRFSYAGHEVGVHRTRYGNLTIALRSYRPVVDTAAWTDDGRLRFGGSYHEPTGRESVIVLTAKGRVEEHEFPMVRTGDRWSVDLPVTALDTLAGRLPLSAGIWEARVRAAAGDDSTQSSVKFEHRFLSELPLERTVRGRQYRFTDQAYDSVVLRVESDLLPDERGRYRQHQLQTVHYPAARSRPLRGAVLFDSYTGKQFSDSPRAIHEELARRGSDLELLWVVRDQQVELPDGATPVRLWGRDWFDALADCRYLVTNAHLPQFYRRRRTDGQVCVQTWHGTPLKKIGFDIENVQFGSNYEERLRVEVPNWSHLVSPNRFSTPILERAFGFVGEMLEIGYPRNDILYSPEADAISRKVRERIGVPADAKVLLYTPTWRDNKYYSPGRFKLDLHVDLDDARAKLSDEWVLLVRRHPNIVDNVPGAGNGFVFDVSDYPDVAELYVASDALVTDYSSVMFDFANLRRPMLFFTYDIEEYRDQLRGFYFDFEETAPGPLLSTSEELVEAVRSIDDVASSYAGKYADFVATYCDLDDGHATERLVDRVFGA